MCSQKLRLYVVHPVGSVIVWDSVSVVVVPQPSSQASQLPLCGGSAELLLITSSGVWVDGTFHGEGLELPFSKPGLPSSCAGVQVLPVGVAVASLLCGPSPMAFTAVTL